VNRVQFGASQQPARFGVGTHLAPDPLIKLG
jgi:hypothetical protein